MSDVVNLTYTSKISDFCEINSSFDKAILRICYTGKNRNNSFLSRETIERSVPTLYNCPIVCSYNREENTLGGHDIEAVCDEGGTPHIVNITTPVGVVPESANVWFENIEEDDGTSHEYLCAEVLLWKRQEAYRKIKEDGIVAHSMEINVKSGKSSGGVYYIEDFEFNAFALIGIEPCFESARLELFSLEQQISEMMDDLKDVKPLDTLKETSGLYIHKKDETKGGNIKLNKTKNEAVGKNGKPYAEDYSLVGNLTKEIKRELRKERAPQEWGEDTRYEFVDFDLDTKEVYCFDTVDWLLYGFGFSTNADTVSIDFDSKKRKKFVIADFESGENIPTEPLTVFSELKSKLTDFAKSQTQAKEKLDTASAELETLKTELDGLREFKKGTEAERAKQEAEAVFSKFRDLNGIEEFESLKLEHDNLSTEALEEKCFAIRGKNAVTLSFSAKNGSPKLKIDKPNLQDEPYGGLFVKYYSK